jgi:tRNA threonylcarbamoyladenosine biosynthesis protein TsaB
MRGTTLVASSKGVAEESHSVNLLSQIEDMLAGANITLRDIDLYATAAGPGSFTGLRIGLATIKAFAATFKRRCIGVPTLHAVAHASGVSELTCALLPAGRGEVYAQLLSVNSEMAVTPLSEAQHLPPQVLIEVVADMRSLRWAGAGAHLYAQTIRAHAQTLEINFIEEQNASSSSLSLEVSGQWTLAHDVQELAEHIALLAIRKASDNEDNERHVAQDLHAIYVRPSDAELNSHVKG